MKGITHFAIGIAVASCFPEAVRQGAAGNPLYFILAGIAGLLPDTLDFKLVRFLYKVDMAVIPDPLRPDASCIADAVAVAIRQAHASGLPVNLKLNTVPLSADRWQRYHVHLDGPARCVRVTYGPEVDTGGNPVSAAPTPPVEAIAPLACGIELDYLATTDVDIVDGPVFRMELTKDGRVRPVFIPWHRSWTHSVVPAAVLGLAAANLWTPLAGLVVTGAYAAHILADLAGYQGSNLFAPFTRRRSAGLKLAHAIQPLPNFAAVWMAVVITFWNLARATSGGISGWNPLRFVLVGGALPIALFWLLHHWAARSEAGDVPATSVLAVGSLPPCAAGALNSGPRGTRPRGAPGEPPAIPVPRQPRMR